MTEVAGHSTMSSAIKDAHNYHNWLCSLVLPHLGKRTLEVGPGYGQYTRFFASKTESLSIADIDSTCIEYIKQNMPEVHAFEANLDSDEWSAQISETECFDTIIALNVIEHLKDDAVALSRLHSSLTPGGKLLLVVPAHQVLYGQMDALAGHYRRYGKHYLHALLVTVGFSIHELQYINPIGGIGWFLNAKLHKPTTLSDNAVNSQIIMFDRYILPLSKLLTPAFSGMFGQSLWCCAVKH